MTRGYFVFEKGNTVEQAVLLNSDAYLEGYGHDIIKAFSEGREKDYLQELYASSPKSHKEELRYIRPEWYRKTKNSQPDDYMQEYAYVVKSGKLKIYNYGKLIITITKDTAADWERFTNDFSNISNQMLYSDELLALDFNREPQMYKTLSEMAENHKPFEDIPSKYRKYYYLDNYNTVDVWDRPGRPAFQKYLRVSNGDDASKVTFILQHGDDTYREQWKVFLQLPYIRVQILCGNRFTSQKKAVEHLRSLIKSISPKNLYAY